MIGVVGGTAASTFGNSGDKLQMVFERYRRLTGFERRSDWKAHSTGLGKQICIQQVRVRGTQGYIEL